MFIFSFWTLLFLLVLDRSLLFLDISYLVPSHPAFSLVPNHLTIECLTNKLTECSTETLKDETLNKEFFHLFECLKKSASRWLWVLARHKPRHNSRLLLHSTHALHRRSLLSYFLIFHNLTHAFVQLLNILSFGHESLTGQRPQPHHRGSYCLSLALHNSVLPLSDSSWARLYLEVRLLACMTKYFSSTTT